MAGCVNNTNSIALTTTGGALTADAIIDPASSEPPNPLGVSTTGLYVQGANGWLTLPAVLAYSTTDGPTFVATTSVDLTLFIGPGDKIWLTQSSSLYFIVTAITSSTLTLYGGTNYTLTNAAITLPYFSKWKSPIGFPLNPALWTQELNDTSEQFTSSPSASTWYNLGSLALSIPIGGWRVLYEVAGEVDIGSPALLSMFVTLSTANNSASDTNFTGYFATGNAELNISQTIFREKYLLLAAKTAYFLNAQTAIGSASLIQFRGDKSPTIIRAVCAYL